MSAGREDDSEGHASDPLERVNAFPIGDYYLFRHYFENETIFERLKPHYNNQEYRFEVPVHRFDQVRAFLRDRGYELREVDEFEPFAVVVEQYTAHPENIFNAAVLHRSVSGYNVFLLRDRDSVETVIRQGATRLGEADIAVEFRARD